MSDARSNPDLDKNLASLYNNVDTGLRSAHSLWLHIRQRVPAPRTVLGYKYEPTYRYVQNWIQNQASHSTHTNQRVKHYFPIRANRYAPCERMQMDIMFVGNANDTAVVGSDRESTCALIIIDTVTRYLFAYPMKSKSGSEIISAFGKFLSDIDKLNQFPPTEMDVDQEAGFQGSLKTWCQEKGYDINFVPNTLGTLKDNLKLAFVDRSIRTLRTLIDKYQIQHDTSDWLHALPEMVESYNNTPNSATGEKPEEMLLSGNTEGESWQSGRLQDEKQMDQRQEKAEEEPWNKADIGVGSLVRLPVSVRNSTFYKKSKQRWQTVPTKVTGIEKGIYYNVETPSGTQHQYKKYQLLPVRKSMHSNISDTSLYPFNSDAKGGVRRATETAMIKANTKQKLAVQKSKQSSSSSSSSSSATR
jgi:hypothetical protein